MNTTALNLSPVHGGLSEPVNRIDAGAVSLDTRQMSLCRPPAVAVHDDSDVSWKLLEVDLTRQRFVRRPRPNPGQKLL